MAAPDWLTSLPRPALMGIGDSIMNGMRSVSITQDMAASSIAALVGRSLDAAPGFAAFQPALYPRPILFDLEQVLAERVTIDASGAALAQVLAALGPIKAGIASNAREWLDDFEQPAPRGPLAYDNLAIAGARIEDLFNITYAQAEARTNAMAPVLRAKPDPLQWSGDWPAGDPLAPGAWTLGDVHIALNSRHLRNPANQPGLDSLTVVDMVAARRPRVLLVNIGPNHGLVSVAIRNGGASAMAGLREFARDWPACARELAALPDVEAVIVLLMPRPSQIPCLMPPNPNDPGASADLEPAPSGPNGYFSSYVSALDPLSSGFGYTGAQVMQFDREVDEINADVQAATEDAFAETETAAICVSLAELLQRHDFKHRRGPTLPGGPTPPGSARAYSNYALGWFPRLFAPGRLRGGFCGLDHVHPTTIGYRTIAEEIRQAVPVNIASTEITVSDAGDPFLLRPHRPSLALLDSLYPRAPEMAVRGPRISTLAADQQAADRLLFRPGWLR